MDNRFLIDSKDLPFCKGCGHAGVAQNTEKALQKLGYHPLDVIFVTDIGCHGIIDKSLRSHTVHGLHGRSVALAGGIAAGLPHNSNKKVNKRSILQYPNYLIIPQRKMYFNRF